MSPTAITSVRTGDPALDDILPRIRGFLAQDTMDCEIDGQPIHGYRSPDSNAIWIRDHSDMMRGARYFDADIRSAVDHFAETQARNGRLFDFVTTQPEKAPWVRENWTKYVRVPVEADVEYRWVKALYLAWQASADDDWMARLLPTAEKALGYSFSHPWRWDPGRRLVKRAYTIDTWDFDYTAGRCEWLNFQISPKTFWGIMHGDSSGYYEAVTLMARMYARLGDAEASERWQEFGSGFRERANAASWNGRFYRHFVPLVPVSIDGVEEEEQLSLSNPMAINRGLATYEMATAILHEYLRRRDSGSAFAEWFSIDPPFPDGIFGDEKLVKGAYVNGGILPLVGGELARAAFENGMEDYGLDILRRYGKMISDTGETYLWYFPDGRPSSVEVSTSPEAQPTDGWGSSAMLNAFVEGLCGVQDEGRGFDHVRLCPRWEAAGQRQASVTMRYPASNRGFSYEYQRGDSETRIRLSGRADIDVHLMLPRGTTVSEVRAGNESVEFKTITVQSSPYLDVRIRLEGSAEVVIDTTTGSAPGRS